MRVRTEFVSVCDFVIVCVRDFKEERGENSVVIRKDGRRARAVFRPFFTT